MLSDDLALVQTVDFFAPIVDDPFLFGQIAAANALSDVFAMGGEPLTALNIVGFPSGKLPVSVLTEILRGGQEKVHEAGALIVGGHTIIDEELKYGLSVTGRVHPQRILSNANAKVGDRLVLTKPLGTALLATAMKQGNLGTEEASALYASMCKLNAAASRAALTVGARCATDVTGFGLLGHASHIAAASGVTLRFDPFVFNASGSRSGPGVAERESAEPNETDLLSSRASTSPGDGAATGDSRRSADVGRIASLSPRSRGRVSSFIPEAVEIGSFRETNTRSRVCVTPWGVDGACGSRSSKLFAT